MVAIKNPGIGYPADPLQECPAFVPLQGVELALFRARPAFDAGWQLTPEEALSLMGGSPQYPVSTHNMRPCDEIEDDAEDLAFEFGES
jgi:hypothetical protein